MEPCFGTMTCGKHSDQGALNNRVLGSGWMHTLDATLPWLPPAEAESSHACMQGRVHHSYTWASMRAQGPSSVQPAACPECMHVEHLAQLCCGTGCRSSVRPADARPCSSAPCRVQRFTHVGAFAHVEPGLRRPARKQTTLSHICTATHLVE